MRSRAVLVLAVMALAAVGIGAFLFLDRESPEEVDIDRAVAGVIATAPSDPQDAAAEPDDLDPSGTWTVDLDAVPFDSATGAGTWVGYRVDEELSGVGAFTAVGRSPRVEGRVVIDGSRVVEAEIGADLVGLVSDNANRDSRVRPLFTDRPVTFVLSEPVEFGAVPAEGQRVAVAARGVLSIGDIAQEVDVELSADVAGERLVVTGSTLVVLADYDVVVPSATVVLSVSDEATVELQLYLTRG